MNDKEQSKHETMLSSRVVSKLSISGFRERIGAIIDNSALFMRSTNSEYEHRFESYSEGLREAFTEGTVRAALFGSLRTFLPKSWYVQAEAQYPGDLGLRIVADVLVYDPHGNVVVFEVKKNALTDVNRMKKDVDKITMFSKSRNSPVCWGVYVVPVLNSEHVDETINRYNKLGSKYVEVEMVGIWGAKH